MTKASTPKAGKSAKARKPARTAAARTASKIVKPAADSTVYMFQPRHKAPTQTMETFMTQKKHQFEKLTATAASSQKEQVDAMMKSSNIAIKGMEDIFKTVMQVAQTAAEKNAQGFKNLLGCKTLNEFTETQNRLAQQSFDDFMSTTTRLSELTVKLATDAFEPINDQFSRTIQKASSAVAA